MTPAGTSNELDAQNEWEENTQNTHWSRIQLQYDVLLFLSSPCSSCHKYTRNNRAHKEVIVVGGAVPHDGWVATGYPRGSF